MNDLSCGRFPRPTRLVVGRGADDSSRRGIHAENGPFHVRAAGHPRLRGGRGGLERGRPTLGGVARPLHGRRQLRDAWPARPAGLRHCRRAVGRGRGAGRPRADGGRGREAGRAGRRRAAAARRAGPHASAARRRAGGGRLQRVALVRRAGRHPRRAVLDRPAQPADREARGDRAHAAGARDRRAEGHEEREDGRRRYAAGRPLHVHDPRARVDLHGGEPPPAPLLRGQLRQERRRHEPRQHVRAVVPGGRQPGRLPVHVRPPAAVAEEPPRQRRGRADHRERRRRPEPQLRRRLGLRQRRLVDAVLRRRLPRHRPRFRARDTGAPGADRPAQVQVPDHVPLVRPADPLSVRVAGADAVGGRPAVRRVLGDRRDPGDQRLRPGRGRRPVHHERHHRRLLVREDRRAVVDGRAERGLRRLRVRVPRRRVARAGRVREEPAVRPRPREVGGEPGTAGLAPGQHGQALLPRHGQGREGSGRARPGEDEQPRGRLHVLRLVRRPAAGAGARQARPERGRHRGRGDAELPGHAQRGRAGRADRRRRVSGTAASAAGSATSTTTSCRAS